MSATVEQALADAHRFLGEHGAEREARLLATLAGGGDPGWLVAELAGRQAPSGAIAPDAGGEAGLASTLDALDWLDALGRLDEPPAEAAAGYLASLQRDDGSWPADGGDALVATARVAGALAKMPFGAARVLEQASAYLAAQWSVERVQAGDLAPIAGYFHVLTNFPSELSDEALQWCGRELERGFRSGAFDAVSVARVFVLCEAFALPGARLDAAELVEALRAAQLPDGGWPAADDPLRCRATRDAAVALVHLLGGRRSC